MVVMETKLVIISLTLLVVLNVVSLYLFIKLLNYDEIIGFLPNGEEKIYDSRNLGFFFLLTGAMNVLFLSISLISKIFSK